MFDFWQLVRNEDMKLYFRLRTWIMLGIPVVAALAIVLIAASVKDFDPTMWTMQTQLGAVLTQLVLIFAIVIGADSVAGEFSAGTIKLLLIRPWSRSTILLSKYISLLLFSLFGTALVFGASILFNLLLFGYSGGSATEVFNLPSDQSMNVWSYMLLYYLLKWVSMIVVVTFAFMLSTVFRSSGLAISLALIIVLVGGSVTSILGFLNYKWTDYIFLVHLNLAGYLGGITNDGMTLGFALSVLAVYYVLFIVITWVIFKKRDVAA